MIYKSLTLIVLFSLFIGANKVMSQEDPCDLVEQIGSAVERRLCKLRTVMVQVG